MVQGREIDGASANSSPTASTVYSPQSNVVSSTPKPVLNLAGGVDSKSNEQVSCKYQVIKLNLLVVLETWYTSLKF